jgi:hypothetical protein
MDIEDDELNEHGHHHIFDVYHEIPADYNLTPSQYITCNMCGHVVMFADDDYSYNGFLHCQRPMEKKFQARYVVSDLFAEDFLKGRMDVPITSPAGDVLWTDGDAHRIKCNYDMCWCYFKVKMERPCGTILPSCEC